MSQPVRVVVLKSGSLPLAEMLEYPSSLKPPGDGQLSFQSVLETAGASIQAAGEIDPEVYFLTAKFSFSGLQNKKRDLLMARGPCIRKKPRLCPADVLAWCVSLWDNENMREVTLEYLHLCLPDLGLVSFPFSQ